MDNDYFKNRLSKPNDSAKGVILDLDLFGGIINNSDSTVSYYIKMLVAVAADGSKIKLKGCTAACTDNTSFTVDVATVTLASGGKFQLVTIKIKHDSGASKATIDVDSANANVSTV